MAVAVALLMIGGEFDLSAGAMSGTTGLTTGILMTEWDINVWLAILASFWWRSAIGLLNGVLVMRTGLPSFIVTLGTFFVLQGVNLAVTKLIINQVSVTGLQNVGDFEAGQQIFGSFVKFPIGGTDLTLYAATFWWVAVTDRGHLGAAADPRRQLDLRGRWGADQRPPGRRPGLRDQGRAVRHHRAVRLAGRHADPVQDTTIQSITGVGQEFIFIICAVVGGCLLTGGYGSAVGAALGALIYGMVRQGIVYEGWDSDWTYAFLGVMLLGAVVVNNWVRDPGGGSEMTTNDEHAPDRSVAGTRR